MKTKKVFLLLNGNPPKKVPKLNNYDIICATDGAYNYLKQVNITPHFISGDLDSIKELPQNIEVINTPNQDFTDFDKILQILYNKSYLTIDVFGASGKEQDHFLGNLHTALQWKNKLKLTFYDDFSYYFLADKHTKVANCNNKIVSLIPFPFANNVSTKGLQYPLKKENLLLGKRIGTRNCAIKNNIEINFDSGELFIFINRNKKNE